MFINIVIITFIKTFNYYDYQCHYCTRFIMITIIRFISSYQKLHCNN